MEKKLNQPTKERKFKPVTFLIILLLVPNFIFGFIYFMTWLQRGGYLKDEPLIIKKEAIIVVFNKKEFDKHKELSIDDSEKEIEKLIKISRAGEIGGKECNQDICRMAVMGLSADRLYQLIRPTLKKLPVDSGYLEYIYDIKQSNDVVKKSFY